MRRDKSLNFLLELEDTDFLIKANKLIVQRVKYLYRRKGQAAILDFKDGDKVLFMGRRGIRYTGTIMRLRNIKALVDCGLNGKRTVRAANLTKEA